MKKKLIVITSPSGAGKTTIVEKLLDKYNFNYSVSTTTRSPRENEIQNKDYYFVSKDEFLDKIKDDLFIEYDYHYEHFYGIEEKEIIKAIDDDNSTIFVLDVHGALLMSELYEKDVITIFIKPPSKEILKKRLINRKSETISEIDKRLDEYEYELTYLPAFNYVITNDKLESTLQIIETILKDEII